MISRVVSILRRWFGRTPKHLDPRMAEYWKVRGAERPNILAVAYRWEMIDGQGRVLPERDAMSNKANRIVTRYKGVWATFKHLRPGDLFTLKDEGDDPKEDGSVLNLALGEPFETGETYGIKCAPVGVVQVEDDDSIDISKIPDELRNAAMILRHVRDHFKVSLEHLCALIYEAERKETDGPAD